MSDGISIKPVSAGSLALSMGASSLTRMLPEPRSSLASFGQSVLSTGMGAIGSVMTGGSMDLTSLLNTQIQIQQQMQVISMASNIAKSQHETEMAPIRNMRVG
jgi:hypothetical protein